MNSFRSLARLPNLLTSQTAMVSEDDDHQSESSTWQNDDAFAAVELALAPGTNIDVRRRLCEQLVVVMNDDDQLAVQVANRLLDGFAQAKHTILMDAIADALVCSSPVLDRVIDDNRRHSLHNQIRQLARPGRHTLQLAALIYATEPATALERLNADFSNSKSSSRIAAELLKSNNDRLPKRELLKLIFADMPSDADLMIECLDQYERVFDQDVDKVRATIISALPNPKLCSNDSWIVFMTHLRLQVGASSTQCIQALLVSQSRLQRNPELLSAVYTDFDELADLLRNQDVAKMFCVLTVDFLQSASTRRTSNWIHVDSAIALLNQIANFMEYDEDDIHSRILTFVYSNEDDDAAEDEDAGYVRLTAAKFLLDHAPRLVLVDRVICRLFLKDADTELRIAILNRLTLCTTDEMPSRNTMNTILDECQHLESSDDVQSAAARLAAKLARSDGDAYGICADTFAAIVDENTRRRDNAKVEQLNELAAMVEAVKMCSGGGCVHLDCY